ncbi:MAG: 3-oxoacyl-ACP synthase III [Victivallales bacterium]|jgi:acyl-CoA:acyl-CoA alkyltransferase|nr:3-oxoacyl-ACP synthase III [Victivallales bacterium]MBT7166104.1 3-oxoacyl-ACP synthase III [Victivallales bacterium]MBT7301760.1 3-oxoacyl-ACP synthase III [Victivallales bacterium]
MRYTDVCIEAASHFLPKRIVSSTAVEKWLKPVYDRLHLPEGRLELMTGIRERRFWEKGTRPSQVAATAGRLALEKANVARKKIGCLIHCAVSRDFLEPATASVVHRLLDLPRTAMNLDISNACLGVLTGMVMVANMIQGGQIEAGMVVTGETAEPLLDGTVAKLLGDETLTRRTIKPQIASLTIGSAAAAVVLTHSSISASGHRLLGGGHACNTACNDLCQGASSGEGQLVMQTNAPELLARGIDVAEETWTSTKAALGWENDTPDAICGHQVGRAHREQLYARLGLDHDKDFSTFEFLGNCGSASLPVTASLAEEAGHFKQGDRVAWLGIGSGINCTMLGIDW